MVAKRALQAAHEDEADPGMGSSPEEEGDRVIFSWPGVVIVWLWLLLPQSQNPLLQTSPAWETQRVTDDKPRIHKVTHVQLTTHLEFLVSRYHGASHPAQLRSSTYST